MSDDKINAETYRGWLQQNGYIQIRESDESNAVLKELEPEILSGAVIGTVVIYRAERWQVIIQKDFYEKNKSNPESLTGVVKKAIDQLFIEEQRSNFVLPKGEQIVLEQFADGETRKSLLWAEDGGCVIQHFEEGKNGVYPLYLERIFPLDKNQILIYKKQDELFVLDKSRGLFLHAKDYVTKINVATKYRDVALQAFAILPVEDGQPYGLELIEIDGRIGLPPSDVIYSDNWYAQKLKNALVLSGDREKLEQLSQELWEIASPKQRSDIAAIIGAGLFNAICSIRGLAFRQIMVHLGGVTGAGKTWIARMSLKLYFGFDLSPQKGTLLSSDILSSPFRFATVVSSGNLPILIDEATAVSRQLIDLLKAKSLGAIGARGRADLSMTTYNMQASLITTSQSNIFSEVGSIADDMALASRLYVNIYEEGDSDAAKKLEHDLLAAKVKEGGLVYLWLSEFTAQELEEIVLDAYKAAGGDSVTAAVMLGLGFIGRLNLENLSQIKHDPNNGEDPRQGAVSIIENDFEQISAGRWGNATLSTLLDKDVKWMYVSSMYLQHINKDQHHPLYGRFRNLGALKELASVLGVKPEEIYDRTARHKFGGVAATFAKLPINNVDNEDKSKCNQCNQSVTEKIYDILSINNNIVTQLHKLHTNISYIPNPAIGYVQNQNCVTAQNNQSSDDKQAQNTLHSTSTTTNSENPNISDDKSGYTPPDLANSSFQNNENITPNAPSPFSLSGPVPGEEGHASVFTASGAQEGSSPKPPGQPQDKLAVATKVLNAVRHAEVLGKPFWKDEGQGEPSPELLSDLEELYSDQIEEALRELERSSDIYSPRPGYWRVVHAEIGD